MKANILIVDDEPMLVKALVKYLTREGYNVDTAGDGAEAVEKCKETNYDLVLTDLQMPNMTGTELVKELKALNPQQACIVMTGYGSIASAVETMKVGAFHYITKP